MPAQVANPDRLWDIIVRKTRFWATTAWTDWICIFTYVSKKLITFAADPFFFAFLEINNYVLAAAIRAFGPVVIPHLPVSHGLLFCPAAEAEIAII
jgi:hypothetical protein